MLAGQTTAAATSCAGGIPTPAFDADIRPPIHRDELDHRPADAGHDRKGVDISIDEKSAVHHLLPSTTRTPGSTVQVDCNHTSSSMITGLDSGTFFRS